MIRPHDKSDLMFHLKTFRVRYTYLHLYGEKNLILTILMPVVMVINRTPTVVLKQFECQISNHYRHKAFLNTEPSLLHHYSC